MYPCRILIDCVGHLLKSLFLCEEFAPYRHGHPSEHFLNSPITNYQRSLLGADEGPSRDLQALCILNDFTGVPLTLV